MNNIVWHKTSVTLAERIGSNGHNPCIIWYTGLSGSGKSTIANVVDRKLYERGCHSYVLDGDNVRHGLNKDLGFDDVSRVENIRRITEVANLMTDAGLIVGTAFISPFMADREQARKLAASRFIEVYVDTPLAVCEQRDPKGLYKKARAGDIPHFTGISSPYEPPVMPEVHLRTASLNVEEAAEQVIQALIEKDIIS
ncbi:adenylyl-sulfate kinase [Pseudidiomarina sp. GXY010]|uniref:Adenylyl-sulfate kinase n=1 Tax=Pseudidiomarina fusca TaxID=2965078 RepID=A0ABU3KXZ6_9GAMM|nr:adenylyl-sulfate kinase [Pseudidiomarina sp. GXY010]MDT7526331.1 adenylyl-sulfate kinase [Pseudidiomarina sp. GXY010]